jgi:hypothetical protein
MQSCWISISERIPTSLPLQRPSGEFALVLEFRPRKSKRPSVSSRRIPHVLDLGHSQPSNLMYVPYSCSADYRISAPTSKKKAANTGQRQVVNVDVVGSISYNYVIPIKSTDTHPSISPNSMSWTNSLKSKSQSSISTKVTKFHTSLPISKSWRTLKLNTLR